MRKLTKNKMKKIKVRYVDKYECEESFHFLVWGGDYATEQGYRLGKLWEKISKEDIISGAVKLIKIEE